jgi:maltooligosyltrehalose trehalohydrolase
VAVEIEPADGSAGERGRSGVDRPGTERPAFACPLESGPGGYHSGFVPEARPGTRYRFRLDDGSAYADPASRYQPSGPHGPSQVVDPSAFPWTDAGWRGIAIERPPGPVLYELHVGTFTPEGTWGAARERLPHLRDLGVTALELMPVADFPGRFGWGYDGVLPFAPYHGYGEPDDMRRFVDAAHAEGLAVILDVVYNHLGPDGCSLGAFSRDYFSRTHTTEWGDALSFDGPGAEAVRAYVLANVRHWITEYHLDGFRFDATQALHDSGPDHILAALAREARAAAGERRTLLVGENEPQDSTLVRSPREGGHGLDVIGNEDFHHTAVVALTGRREGYYGNHRGTPQELVSALERGFLYQGQWYPWQRQRRGSSTRGLPPRSLAHHLENHDQVANTPGGARLHTLTAPGRWRGMVAVQLLGPQTPFLFQGQEFASSAPFHYFADQAGELARATREGRAEFLSQFRDLATVEGRSGVPDPADPETFRRSRLDWSERDTHAWALALHRDLLRLRADDPTFSGRTACTLDGAVLDAEAFVMRWWTLEGEGDGDRLLLVNLGRDLSLAPAPEPRLAPPPGRAWTLRWSSQDPRYGGPGTPSVETGAWNLPGGSAIVMAPAPAGASDPLRNLPDARADRGVGGGVGGGVGDGGEAGSDATAGPGEAGGGS